MTDSEKINELLRRLDFLILKQDENAKEIVDLAKQVFELKKKIDESKGPEVMQEKVIQPIPEKIVEAIPEKKVEIIQEEIKAFETPKSFTPPKVSSPKIPSKSNLEKFIGENLINKIGIVVLIFGVAIGAKYAIDHNLINPLTRIVLGYCVGLGLLFFAIRLKKNYVHFSSVLLSGAMTIMYFITYLAYNLYGIIPKEITFVLMVVFTIFTVIAALNYNQQIIALLGLVGAYAVPFLLSDGSGKVLILFSYMCIINCGVLFIAFNKDWKRLYYSAFILSWLIYITWYTTKYTPEIHFSLSLTFAFLFFAIFYSVFLAYKLIRKEIFGIKDVILLLINSFIFYLVGYNSLDSNHSGQLLGLYTLANAIIHAVVSYIIFRKKLADRNLLYLISGLVLVFITIAIPVQLDGNFVTLLWAGEAALLFWIGRTKGTSFYEKLSYPMMIISFFSLLQDWGGNYFTHYNIVFDITPIFNPQFLSSIIFIGFFGFMQYINQRTAQQRIWKGAFFHNVSNYIIPVVLLITCYYSFRNEIDFYWNNRFQASLIGLKEPAANSYSFGQYNFDLSRFKNIWLDIYNMSFVSIVAFINIRIIKNKQLLFITFIGGVITALVFLVQGLYMISELRHSYLIQENAAYYDIGQWNIYIRYVALIFFAVMIFALHKCISSPLNSIKLKMQFELGIHAVILWVASSELIHWLDISGTEGVYKIGLSLLWGSYALFLIILGISMKRKHLRIAAIVLFGVTLLKLFFYDITHLTTVAKTIVLVILGILLLIISFLYNKYKHIISDDKD